MPFKKKRFSPQETKFIQRTVAGASPVTAAREAGYAHPKAHAYAVMARPDVLEAIRREQASKLVKEGLPIAVATLIEIAGDTKQPANARIAASKVIVDRGLGVDDPARNKSPEEMTGEELQRAIQALQRKAADLAKPVIDADPASVAPESVLD